MVKVKSFIHNIIAITRLKKPVGSLLLLVPCLIALFYQVDEFKLSEHDIKILVLLTLGSFVMRSAGCIINDLFDVKFDKMVARTKNRPLASLSMTKTQAIISLIVFLSLGLLILLEFHIYAIYCGFLSLFLVVIYPLMKRVTFFPQIFLGIVFNIGFLLVLLHYQQRLFYVDLVIYLALILFTFVYDTIYGFQDIDDDIKIGVKSSSIVVSKNPVLVLNIVILVTFMLLVFVGYLNNYGYYYFTLNFLFLTVSFTSILRCDFKNSKQCYELFQIFLSLELLILLSFILK